MKKSITKAELIQKLKELEQNLLEAQETITALQKNDAFLSRILDIAIEAVICIDESQRIILFNKGAAQIFGYTPEEIIGQPLNQLIPHSFQNIHHKHIQDFQKSAVTAKHMAERGEVAGLHKSGREFPAEASIAKLRIDRNTIFMVILRDITNRKAIETRLRASEIQMGLLLEQRNRELESFLSASQNMAETIHFKNFLDTVIKLVVGALPQVEAASLWLYDEATDALVAQAWEGYNDESMNNRTIPVSRCLVGLVYRTGQSQYFPDVQNTSIYEPSLYSGLPKVRSALGVPLRVAGTVLGVLFADSFSQLAAFGEADMRLLEALSTQIATALQNVRLFEQVLADREEIRQLVRQILLAQENERRHVARELHDEAGQILVLLKQSLQRTRRNLLNKFNEQFTHEMDRNIELAEQTMQQIRLLAYNLRPPMLDNMDINEVLKNYCEDFSTRSEIPVNYTGQALANLPDNLRITLYRFLQEALTNTLKHAEARTIQVILAYDGRNIRLSIHDDGHGFSLQTETKRKGMGLLNIRERLEALNGHLELESEADRGTYLSAYLPWENPL